MNFTLLGFNFDLWSIIGFLGQFFFFMRFFVQWVASERKGKSIIPVSFWYFSVIGTIVLGIYAYARRDIVFLMASFLNIIIYVRNLALIKKEKLSNPA